MVSKHGQKHRACTLDTPLEESLAALARPHTVVVPGRVVVAHSAEVHVGFPHRRRTQGGVHAFHSFL